MGNKVNFKTIESGSNFHVYLCNRSTKTAYKGTMKYLKERISSETRWGGCGINDDDKKIRATEK